jgi:hypothetical protein
MLAGFTAGLGFFGAGALCAVLLFAVCLWLLKRASE